MDRKELDLIKELMDKLSDEMEYGEEDFAERLGRKKPEGEIKVLKVEGELPLDESEEMDMEMALDDDSDDEEPMYEEEISPEDELKHRLMKLRK